MNKKRREALTAVSERLTGMLSVLESLRSELESLRDEEQDYFDNMPESIQQGAKGQTAEASVDALDGAVSECEDAANTLQTAMDQIAAAV